MQMVWLSSRQHEPDHLLVDQEYTYAQKDLDQAGIDDLFQVCKHLTKQNNDYSIDHNTRNARSVRGEMTGLLSELLCTWYNPRR